MSGKDKHKSDGECLICLSDRVRSGIAFGSAYRDCRACGFVWRVDRENFPDPNRAYAEGGESVQALIEQEASPGRTAYYKAHLKRLHHVAKPPGRLLEIGCGTGGLSKAARDVGWDVLAIEHGPVLRQAAEQLLGPERVLGCAVETAKLQAESFDVVLALDLIEHLPDPFVLVRQASEWLRRSGVLLLQTPNARALRRRLYGARWNMIQPDRHFLFHTARSLETLLAGQSFAVLSLKTVSGIGAGSVLRRACESLYGGVLSVLGMGNALYAVARNTGSK